MLFIVTLFLVLGGRSTLHLVVADEVEVTSSYVVDLPSLEIMESAAQ